MSNRRKPGNRPRNRPFWDPGTHEHDCGCTQLVERAADGVCDSCGHADSMTTPLMPSSQGLGEVTEVGWSCLRCGTGEVVGRGIVTRVVPHG